MRKQEFLAQLRKGLSGLPPKDRDERLAFYSEMIDDRMEEGCPEEEAVGEIGSVDDIVSQILADTPLTKLVKEKIKPAKKWSAWEILLLILGSPIWLSLLIAVFAVAVSLFAVLWSVIISLWAAFGAVAACAFAGIVGGVIMACFGNVFPGVALIGAGIVCAGLAIFLFFGCKLATKGTALLAKYTVLGMKKGFAKKEAA